MAVCLESIATRPEIGLDIWVYFGDYGTLFLYTR
jgi:hypothetical protein